MRRDRQKIARAGQSARRGYRCGVRNCLIIASLYWPGPATAQTEIHKCTDADGGVVYSQLPCATQESDGARKSAPDEKAETAVPVSAGRESLTTEEPQETAELEADRAACQKHFRDAIDAIDAEIGREYTPEKSDEYKQQLLELTRQLRQC